MAADQIGSVRLQKTEWQALRELAKQQGVNRNQLLVGAIRQLIATGNNAETIALIPNGKTVSS